MRAVTVRTLSVTPVKGMRLRTVGEVALGSSGARGDRRFYVIDERARMVNAKMLGALVELEAEYSDDETWLRIGFPDGRAVQAEVMLGENVETSFFSQPVEAQLVEGPWSDAISAFAEQPLRLVQPLDRSAVDRGADGGVTLISRASLERLAEVAGLDAIDARRFRMLIEVDGADAHVEDSWVGCSARIGEARVRFGGHVGRCLVTSRDPDTGRVDVPTLDILERYRSNLDTTEPLPFGIYGEVLEPGLVRVGDTVAVEG